MQLETALPAEVLDQLAPVLVSLHAEVLDGVVAVAHKKVEHAGKVAVRANGGPGSSHDRGFQAIITDLFPTISAAPAAGPTPAPLPTENDCSCTQCEDGECDGECDICDDWDCSQCHDIQRCCGWCEGCRRCHDTDDTRNRYSNGDGVSFCTSCTHFCDG